MEDNFIEGTEENDTLDTNTISDKSKITIINLMFQFRKGNDFTFSRDVLKNFQAITKGEIEFIDEVYEGLQELEIDGEISSEYQQQLKEKLYTKLRIPQEAIEEERKRAQAKKAEAEASIDEKKQLWRKQDEESQTRRGEDQTKDTDKKEEELQEDKITYKAGLYQPGFLCRHPKDTSGKPFVQLVRYPEERIAGSSNSYQFADRVYTIKKSGELFYMSTPNLQESLSEYEITISRDNISKTVRRFGQISLSRMNEPDYYTMVFYQLLGVSNLTDRELQGYIGSLEQVRDKNGKLKNEYRISYLPEEYTAVVLWKEKERERAIARNQGDNIISLVDKKEGIAAGGEER